MIHPAWLELTSDDVIVDHPTALRLYVRLWREYPLIFVKPQVVKADLWGERMHTHLDRISAALRLLIDRGYATEQPRQPNAPREILFFLERGNGTRRIHRYLPMHPQVFSGKHTLNFGQTLYPMTGAINKR